MYKSVQRFIYGPTPEERIKAWQAELRKQSRQLDRDMSRLDMETDKARKSLKQLANKGDVKSSRILAKEIVRSNKQKDRMSVAKARLGSIGIQLQNQLSLSKITGSLQKSTEILKLSNEAIKLPQISGVMRQMSMEMTKAGIMEEMVDDTLEELDQDEELEEEANEEVDKVLFELTDGKFGKVGEVSTTLPNEVEEEALHEEEMDRMRRQLEGLING